MPYYTLEHLRAIWDRAVPPPYQGAYDYWFRLNLPKIGSMLTNVQYDYATARYQLHFVRVENDVGRYVELHTTKTMCRLIRKYVRGRFGIRFISSLRILGEDEDANLPVLLQPQRVDS